MKNNSKFKRFLSNDITLMVFSILLAFAIWFVVNASSQTESNVTISDIPVTIDLPQDAIDDGLQVFTGDDITASVQVSGNRITVGSLSASDIQVTALQSNSIIAPGSYNLELSAKKVGVKTNYNFASNVSPSNITIYVDKLKEKTFDITDELVYKVAEGFYANTSLSDTSVTISGPESEVLAIDRVVVQGTLEGSADSTSKDSFELVYLDKDGNELSINMSTASVETVEATLTPLPTLDVKLELDVINAPVSYPDITLSPSTIKIAAEQSVLDSIEDATVDIGTLNFANLLNKKISLTYDITLPNGCKNLSDSTTTKVSVNLSNSDRKELVIDSFSTDNIDLSKYSVVFNTTSIDVVVCGPADAISEINTADIISKIDFSDKLDDFDKDTISLELPFTFEFTSDYKNCWVYGSYTANVNVTKK